MSRTWSMMSTSSALRSPSSCLRAFSFSSASCRVQGSQIMLIKCYLAAHVGLLLQTTPTPPY